MIPTDVLGNLPVEGEGSVVCEDLWAFAIGSQYLQKTVDQCRICNVQISAVTDGLFHPVCQISEGSERPFERHRHNRPDTALGHDNVNILRLQPAKDRTFPAPALVGVMA